MKDTNLSRVNEVFRNRKPHLLQRHAMTFSILVDAIGNQGYLITEQRLRVLYGLCALQSVSNEEELWICLNDKKKSAVQSFTTVCGYFTKPVT